MTLSEYQFMNVITELLVAATDDVELLLSFWLVSIVNFIH